MSNKCKSAPKTKETNPKSKVFSLRLSISEWKSLETAASGHPISTYIKSILFKSDLQKINTRGKRPVKDHKQIAKLLALLGRSKIAANMSELAKAASSGSLPVNDEVTNSIKEACEAIIWIKCALIKALGLKLLESDINKDDNNDPESE